MEEWSGRMADGWGARYTTLMTAFPRVPPESA